jgi:hypothetical protein
MLEAWGPYAAASDLLGVTDKLLAMLEQAMVDGDFPMLEAALEKAEAAGPALATTPQVQEAKAFRTRVLTVKEGLMEAMDTRNRGRLDRLIPQAEQLGVPLVELQRAVQVRLVLDLPAASVARDLATLRTILQGLEQLGASGHEYEEIVAAEALVRQLDAMGTLRSFITTVEAERSALVSGGSAGSEDGETSGGAKETIAKLKELIELAEEATRAGNMIDEDEATGEQSSDTGSAASGTDDEAASMFVPVERKTRSPATSGATQRAKAEAEMEAARVLASARELLRSLEAEVSILEELREAVARQELAVLAEVLINAAKISTLDGNPELVSAKEAFLEMRGRYKGVVQEGWLWKMGEGKHGAAFANKFRKRWMVLESGELTYYTDQSRKEHKGVVNLALVTRVQVDGNDGGGRGNTTGHKYMFKLITERRVWVLRADSAAELKSWSEDLRNAALAQQLSREHTSRMQQWDSMHYGVGNAAEKGSDRRKERVDSVLSMELASPLFNKRQQPESKVTTIETLSTAERLHSMFATTAGMARQLNEYLVIAHLLDSAYLPSEGNKRSESSSQGGAVSLDALMEDNQELKEEEQEEEESEEEHDEEGDEEAGEEDEEGRTSSQQYKRSSRIELKGAEHDAEVLQKAFEVLDSDGDGLVGEDDVERTLRRINRDPVHHLELFRKFGARGIDQDQVTLPEWVSGFTMHCPGLLPDWVNLLESKYNSARDAALGKGAAGVTEGVTEDAKVASMLHPLKSGSLATGTVLVKQDLLRMEHLFRPVDWRQCFFALLGHTLFIFDDGYSMQVRIVVY